MLTRHIVQGEYPKTDGYQGRILKDYIVHVLGFLVTQCDTYEIVSHLILGEGDHSAQ